LDDVQSIEDSVTRINSIVTALYVRRRRRGISENAETFFGFADETTAEAWVEADGATHRPGPKRKVAD
jgi:hypothetical protein